MQFFRTTEVESFHKEIFGQYIRQLKQRVKDEQKQKEEMVMRKHITFYYYPSFFLFLFTYFFLSFYLQFIVGFAQDMSIQYPKIIFCY